MFYTVVVEIENILIFLSRKALSRAYFVHYGLVALDK